MIENIFTLPSLLSHERSMVVMLLVLPPLPAHPLTFHPFAFVDFSYQYIITFILLFPLFSVLKHPQ